MKRMQLFVTVLLVPFFMAACGDRDEPTEAVSTSVPPTLPPPTALATSAPPTLAPVEPVAPTIPDEPLSTTGPWVFFASDDGVWALNPDGSGVTSLWGAQIGHLA
jgi:hypothetical protein